MAARFRDFSVSAKLIGAFSCVLLVAIALGTFAISRLSEVHTTYSTVLEQRTSALIVLKDLLYKVTLCPTREAVVVLVPEKGRDGALKLLEGAIADTDTLFVQYKSLATTSEGRAIVDKISADWVAYKETIDGFKAAFATQGSPGAAAYLLSAKAKFHNLTDSVDAAGAYEKRQAAAAGIMGRASYTSAVYWIILAMAVALLMCATAGFVLVRAISRPLVQLSGVVGEMAHGSLNVEVPHSDQMDEIGKLAQGMDAFKKELAAAERSKAEQTQLIVSSIGAGLEHLAKGDVTHRVTLELTGPFAKLKENFNAAMDRLQDTLKSVLASTGQIMTGAGEISSAADDLSRRTEQQAASLEETAAALEEITASVKKGAGNAREASVTVAKTKSVAEESGHVVETAIRAMDAIAQSSKQITDIIGVIDEIAFQTNLLALNAGVEAARAGDAGKGFAVVASEVRSLAQRASDAAKEIKTLIKTSGEHVDEGVKFVGETGSALKRIADQVAEINALAQGSAEAGEQQAAGIEQVSSAVGQMDQVTQQNAAMVEQSTAASRNLAAEAKTLDELMSFFSVGQAHTTAPAATRSVPPRQATRAEPRKPALRAVASASRNAAAVKVAPAAEPHNDWTEF